MPRAGTRRQMELVISEDELCALTANMTFRFQLACYLMYYSGLRISEVFKVRWSDLDFDNSLILIRESKNLITRDAILHKEVRALLDTVSGAQRPTHDAKLVPVRAGSAIYSAVKRHGMLIGKPYLHPHSLRHSYATHLVESGIPITDVQMLLGHARIETTSRYVHPTIASIRDKYRDRDWI